MALRPDRARTEGTLKDTPHSLGLKHLSAHWAIPKLKGTLTPIRGCEHMNDVYFKPLGLGLVVTWQQLTAPAALCALPFLLG